MKTIIVNNYGGPETLIYTESNPRQPGLNEVKIRNQAIGLNFTDIYFRKGIYDPGSLPFTPGNEAAGEIIAVGKNVTRFKIGERVAYVSLLGAYAEESIVPADYVAHLPQTIDFKIAAASILKGLTAHYLLRQTFKVEAAHTVLVHAAAGGVGSLLTQWAKYLGATVIGTVGNDEKATLAKANGCDFVIQYKKEDFVARVHEITDGKKCHVVYDGIGQATFPGSLDCLRPLGHFVSFGTASGAIENFTLADLAKRGSLAATSPVLFDYISVPAAMQRMSAELFEMIQNGILKTTISNEFPLSQVAEAHKKLESGQTTGATILLP